MCIAEMPRATPASVPLSPPAASPAGVSPRLRWLPFRRVPPHEALSFDMACLTALSRSNVATTTGPAARAANRRRASAGW